MSMPALSKMDCSRGAPHGRRTFTTTNGDQRFYLQKLPLSQGYDAGGAYWGLGTQMWRYVTEDHNAEGFLRADTREIAKQEIRVNYPAAKFFK